MYRVYNLHPVIHENLRPEKPPKPFPRATEDNAVDGENGEGEVPATPRKRKTRAKARKTEQEADGA